MAVLEKIGRHVRSGARQALQRLRDGKSPIPIRRPLEEAARRIFPRQVWSPPDNLAEQLDRYACREMRVPRAVVYTAIIGGYDKLMIPRIVDPAFDYVCFSDRPLNGYGVWQIKPVPYYHPDPTRVARFVKTHPFLLLQNTQYFIWIDANIGVIGDIHSYLDGISESDPAISFLRHPIRNTLDQELSACIEREKDDREVMIAQTDRYRDEGYFNLGVFETNFWIVRNEPSIRPFFSAWWRELDNYSRRDQLSVAYALETTRTPFKHLLAPGLSCRNHPDFHYIEHERLRLSANPRGMAELGPAFDPWMWQSPLRPAPVQANADVIICVHNALRHLEACLESVLLDTARIRRVIIVDDGSDFETLAFLHALASENPLVELIENEQNLGYSKTANKGLAAGVADFRVLLNSDTVVAAGWLEKMLAVAHADEAIGVVGPMSNAASWQSLPSTKGTTGQTAINPLPHGQTTADLDRACEDWSSGYHLAIVPLVHGFCYGIKASVIECIGLFDDLNFERFYGEENDYCLRAREAGFLLAVSTSTFVYHAKSKSIAEEQRLIWMDKAGKRLREKHGTEVVKTACDQMMAHPDLERMRHLAKAHWGAERFGS